MYVDECGDSGMSQGASDFFILSGMVVHESMWTHFLTEAAAEIAGLKLKYGMDQKVELHAKAMLGRSEKTYSSMSKRNRVLIFRDLFKFESSMMDSIRIINILVDKRDKDTSYDVFGRAWDALVNRFENTILYGNCNDIVASDAKAAQPEHGLIIVDQTDEKKLRDLIRHMRHDNNIPSKLFPGTYVKHNLLCVVEDAMHKDSQNSIPIQICDANAYFLRQLIEPNSTIRKHGAKNYFYALGPVLLKTATRKDPLDLGIVRL